MDIFGRSPTCSPTTPCARFGSASAQVVVEPRPGSYAVLRRQSLLGDAISHAALPGIAIGFLLTGSKSPLVLGVGAAIAGWIATPSSSTIVRHPLKQDTALGLVLSVFFGFGLMLLTFIQKMPNAGWRGSTSSSSGRRPPSSRRT